jgi:secretion/DNA translocation related CpaE-like protein
MPAPTSLRTAPGRPLVVTANPALLDELLRLAAAAGVEVDVAPDASGARARWATSHIVVVGADRADDCVRHRLPRRRGVVLAAFGEKPAAEELLAEALGAAHIAMLPAAEPWLVATFADGHTDSGGGLVVAVLGGRGGAGASILASGLAITGARERLRTLLVDADPYGGGLDLALGWEQIEGLRWPAFANTRGRLDPGALVDALPSRGDLVMISFDRGEPLPLPVDAMTATLDAGRRGRDLVVVDLPRHLDDAAVVALQAADRAYLVVPAELRATAAATQVAKAAARHCERLAAVVRGPAPGRLRAKEVARSVGLPLAGTLRHDPSLGRRLERGEAPATGGRGALADLCEKLLGELLRSQGVAA